MRVFRLLAVTAGLLALAATAGSGRAERQAPPVRATAVVAGLGHTCALTRSGGVMCWGYNTHDELGDGKTPNSTTPVPVSGLASGVTAIAAGLRNTCAITREGGAKCWGAIYFGALGDGTTTRHATPVDVAGLRSGVKAISAGGDDGCAITGSGGAKCWGSNFQGQLGDGTTIDRATPVDVSGLSSGATAIASGLSVRTCVVAGDGRVMCWGRGRLTPTPVSGLGGDVKAITSACAITAAGGVKCWDENLAAVDVSGLDHGVIGIASSGTHNCALTTLGGVKCWGLNNHGQLGDGSKTDRTTPVDVVGLHGPADALATGAYHTCAVLRSGGVDCWGSNETGDLGNGTTVDYARPVAVKGFGTATATVAIVSRSIHVSRTRIAPVRLSCANARCRGLLTLSVGTTDLFVRFSMSAGSRTTVPMKLTVSAFAHLVGAKRLTARLSVTGAVRAARKVTLVAP